jgi:hypothetical protein
MVQEIFPDWAAEQIASLAKAVPSGNGRVKLGAAFDPVMLPDEIIKGFYTKARGIGVQLMTVHSCRTPVQALLCPSGSRVPE